MLLCVDGGAERLGWGILEREGNKPVYIDSGLVSFPQSAFPGTFQEYRLGLIDYYVDHLIRPGSIFDDSFLPITDVVTEILPPVGFGNGVQAYLVNVALTVVQTIATLAGLPVHQISASTVHSKIAVGRKGRKVTKVQVRNGVIQLLPELAPRKREWVKIFDEPDSLAVGLTYLGFKNGV
jgi:Holliday junction resolvasome RuvABC endonuclease subunit